MIYCLFEQSGTFKNEFIKAGYNAIDIDIDNQFSCTDMQIDLFKAINKLPNGFLSDITSDDMIIAFFLVHGFVITTCYYSAVKHIKCVTGRSNKKQNTDTNAEKNAYMRLQHYRS